MRDAQGRPRRSPGLRRTYRKDIAALSLPTRTGVLRFTVSIGIATLGEDLRDWDALLQAADAAMYEAKRTGRNRTVLANV